MGNYLNVDGKAAGFKLNTLWGIDSVRATSKDGFSIIHLVAQRMQDCVSDVKKELSTIQEAAQIPLENVKDETNAISERLKTLTNKIEGKNDTFFTQVKTFIKVCRKYFFSTRKRKKCFWFILGNKVKSWKNSATANRNW